MIEPSSSNYPNENNYSYTENTNTNYERQSFLTPLRKSNEYYNSQNLTTTPIIHNCQNETQNYNLIDTHLQIRKHLYCILNILFPLPYVENLNFAEEQVWITHFAYQETGESNFFLGIAHLDKFNLQKRIFIRNQYLKYNAELNVQQ